MSETSVNEGCDTVGEMTYRRVQSSMLMWFVVAFGGFLVVGGLSAIDDLGSGAGWYFVLCGALMSTGVAGTGLSVVVDDDAVTTAFRSGWPRRRIELDDVIAARHVQNSWGHGWGIRKIRNGWMFNIAGSDAIELTLRSGRVFRIGTDQPAELLAAIERVQTA